MKLHLIQLRHVSRGARVGIVLEPDVVLLDENIRTCYQLFSDIVNNGIEAGPFIQSLRSNEILSYDEVYHSAAAWKIRPPVDCEDDPMKCMLSGTGLTHKASAANRQKMHERQETDQLTDSMKMYLLGEQGGKPGPEQVGVQPEWFYKGNGSVLKGHGDALAVPGYADDGGEEPEIAGVYLISDRGIPHRLGFVQANEFSDHLMEKQNYLYLAPSKLRHCAIGPELVVGTDFHSLEGTVKIVRKKTTLWSRNIRTGEGAMAHSLANLEHHHFKYQQHRLPGQLHIHFFGADAFSFGDNLKLQDGDEMSISFAGMGRPLANSLKTDTEVGKVVEVKSIIDT